MKMHLLAWFDGLGAAYKAANEASLLGYEILELFPFSSKAQLLLEINKNASSSKSFLSEAIRTAEFEDLSPDVLPAYLSLKSPPLQEQLIVYEGAFLGDSFAVAQRASRAGLNILDLRMMRDTTGASYVFLSGSGDLVADFFQKNQRREMTLIKNPSEALRQFFPI